MYISKQRKDLTDVISRINLVFISGPVRNQRRIYGKDQTLAGLQKLKMSTQ